MTCRRARGPAGEAGFAYRIVVASHTRNFEDERQIVDRACQPADGIQRISGLEHARSRHQTEGRLEAKDAAIARRPDDRARRLRRQAQRHHRGGDGDGRAAGGGSRSPRRIIGIERRTGVMDREFGRHRLSGNERPRQAKSAHHPRIIPWGIAGVDGAAHLGRHVIGVEDVLETDRDSEESRGESVDCRSSCQDLIQRRRALLQATTIEPDPGLEPGVQPLDAVGAGPRVVADGNLPPSEQAKKLAGGEIGDRAGAQASDGARLSEVRRCCGHGSSFAFPLRCAFRISSNSCSL